MAKKTKKNNLKRGDWCVGCGKPVGPRNRRYCNRCMEEVDNFFKKR